MTVKPKIRPRKHSGNKSKLLNRTLLKKNSEPTKYKTISRNSKKLSTILFACNSPKY